MDALTKSKIGTFKEIGTEIVGPAVGRELRSRGLWATVLSLVGILAYIGFRFQFSFGVGAVVATIHDLLVTLAFLAIFRYDVSLNVIAAIGDDRYDQRHDRDLRPVREPEGPAPRLADKIINAGEPDARPHHHRRHATAAGCSSSAARSCTSSRSMVVGIITGTYSSIFIAAAIISLWKGSTTRAASRPRLNPAPRPSTAAETKPQTKSARRNRPSLNSQSQLSALSVLSRR